ELVPGRWLVAWHHGVTSYLRNAAGGWDVEDTVASPYHIEEPSDIAISPSRDRAAIIGRDWLGTGMPVFSASSANPVYFLPGSREIWGAAFSDEGDSLFVIGPPLPSVQPYPYTPPNLAIVAASDGRVLKSVPAWPDAYRLVLDPGGRWIYLPGAMQDPGVKYRSQAPALQVLDRATLAPVTTIQAPFGTDIGGMDLYPVLSPSEHRLYLVATCAFCSASTTPIYAFDLMP
ncbi:MAG TPA: hypothetical protein VEH83_12670, partial [Gemmatimonadales bacterium]|nr:hypothetical protein [Gemmatimonadales bacterium]